MADIYLDPNTQDLYVSPTGAARLTEATEEETLQRLCMRLRRLSGEWFLDTRLGVPYRSDILVKNPNLNVIKSILTREILSDPGVESVTEMSLTHDKGSRTLAGAFTAVLVDGETLADDFVLTPVSDDLGSILELDGGEVIVP